MDDDENSYDEVRREWGLPRVDQLGPRGSVKLREETLEALREAKKGSRPPAHHEGADRSNSVWVTVSGKGVVKDVDISQRWRERLQANELAAALFAAYGAAVGKALRAMAIVMLAEERVHESHQDQSAVAADSDSLDAEQREGRGEDWLRSVSTDLKAINEELGRMEHAPAVGGHEHAISGPRGLVTLRVRDREVVGVTADAPLVATAEPSEVRADAIAAFRKAQRQ